LTSAEGPALRRRTFGDSHRPAARSHKKTRSWRVFCFLLQ